MSAKDQETMSQMMRTMSEDNSIFNSLKTEDDYVGTTITELADGTDVRSIEVNIQIIKNFFINTIAFYETVIKKGCSKCDLLKHENFLRLHANMCDLENLFKIFDVPFDKTLYSMMAIKSSDIELVTETTPQDDGDDNCNAENNDTIAEGYGPSPMEDQDNQDNVQAVSKATYPCPLSSCMAKYVSDDAAKVHFIKSHCVKTDVFEMSDDGEDCGGNVPTIDFNKLKTNAEGKYECGFENCSYATSDRSNFKVHYVRHSGQRKFVCHICSKNFFTRDPLMSHFLRVHLRDVDWSLASVDIRALRKTIRRLTSREYCHLIDNNDMPDCESDLVGPISEDLSLLSDLVNQTVTQCTSEEVEGVSVKEDTVEQETTPLELKMDSQTIEPLNAFNVTLRLKDADVFSDSVTFKSEGATQNLEAIISKSQETNSPIKTTLSLQSIEGPVVHQDIVQRKKNYKCPHSFCNQTFFTKKNVLIHLKATHDPMNPIACEEPGCKCRFKTPALMAQHRKRHRVQYTCKVCPYKTHLAALMTRHSRQHAGSTLHHECETCGEKFEFLGGLKSHKNKVHNEKEPLMCDWQDCGKRFKTIIGLNKHRREIHLKMKAEIACEWPECNSTFTNRTSMAHHMRIHTNERPFQCTWQDCGKWFRLRETMRRHLKLHQGVKPYACPFDTCDRAFGTRRNMKQHVEKVHNKKASI